MKNRLLNVVMNLFLLLILASTTTVQAAPAQPPDLSVLEPGGFLTIEQELNINIVMVGFDEAAVDPVAFEADLPDTYRTIIRYPAFYGIQQFLGNDFTFDYNFLFTEDAFEDAFFSWLAGSGTACDRTVFQDMYNAQANNVLDIPASILCADAPSVEAYLGAQGAGYMGDYTVFFINWYGRADFQHHVYTKLGETDPDTGRNFGTLDSRKMIAWGGSSERLWFYDFSAGPEAWTDNWTIDAGLSPGFYTIPPIWEYGNPNAYRPFDDLTGDMARLTRFVAIDLLFTPSPLYKPFLSPPALPGTVDIDLNLIKEYPDIGDTSTTFDLAYIQAAYEDFQPYKTFSVDLDDYSLDGRLADVFDCFAADANSCYGNRLFNIAFGDLFLYASDHILQFLDGDADYEIPIFTFFTTAERLGGWFGLLGFADDDWSTGTQSYIFTFNTPEYLSLGYGPSSTAVHEAGHHVGLSHPHDGYDYEYNLDFGSSGPLYFAWAGDESDSVMHYMALSNGFGVFNKDSMHRYETAGYLNEANAILADIYDSPRAAQASSLLLSADAHAAMALAAYDVMDYLGAVTHAQLAYMDVIAAADQLNIPVEPNSWQSDVKAHGQNFHVDPVRYPDQ